MAFCRRRHHNLNIINHMNDQSPNYAYLSGALEGFIKSLPNYYIPGVKVTDADAFKMYLQKHLNEFKAKAIEHNK